MARPQVFLLTAFSIFIILNLSPFSPSISFSAEIALFGGGEIDTRGQGFSQMGMDLTHPVKEGFSLAARLAPTYLTYKYKSGGRLIRAHSPGAYAVGGIKVSYEKTSFGLFGGVEYRYTNLSPDDRTAKVRGDSVAGLVQGELYQQLFQATHLNLFASYSGTDNFFYARAKLKRQITNLDFTKPNLLHVGVEEFYGRNSDFRMAGVGPFLELYHIPHKVSMTFRAGYKHDSTFGSGAYGGIEFYKGF